MVDGSAGITVPILKAAAYTYGQGEAQTIVDCGRRNLLSAAIPSRYLRLPCEFLGMSARRSDGCDSPQKAFGRGGDLDALDQARQGRLARLHRGDQGL